MQNSTTLIILEFRKPVLMHAIECACKSVYKGNRLLRNANSAWGQQNNIQVLYTLRTIFSNFIYINYYN